MYDRYGRNHRMMLCLRGIDELRDEPESDWHVLRATLPVYYLFPNVQLIIGQDGPILVRIYPERADPHHSHTCIGFYTEPEFATAPPHSPTREHDEQVQARMQGFADVIQHEDYRAAASSHIGITSGAQPYLIFGRNEPALHHYHDTYRAALGLAPLETLDPW
jgi:Ring hydroxylating alpha subunit (catalytic domain)